MKYILIVFYSILLFLSFFLTVNYGGGLGRFVSLIFPLFSILALLKIGGGGTKWIAIIINSLMLFTFLYFVYFETFGPGKPPETNQIIVLGVIMLPVLLTIILLLKKPNDVLQTTTNSPG